MRKAKARVPESFERRFWKLVFLLNVGPIALSLAAFLAFFEGVSRLFWTCLAVSFVSFAFAGRTYLVARKELEAAQEEKEKQAEAG